MMDGFNNKTTDNKPMVLYVGDSHIYDREDFFNNVIHSQRLLVCFERTFTPSCDDKSGLVYVNDDIQTSLILRTVTLKGESALNPIMGGSLQSFKKNGYVLSSVSVGDEADAQQDQQQEQDQQASGEVAEASVYDAERVLGSVNNLYQLDSQSPFMEALLGSSPYNLDFVTSSGSVESWLEGMTKALRLYHSAVAKFREIENSIHEPAEGVHDPAMDTAIASLTENLGSDAASVIVDQNDIEIARKRIEKHRNSIEKAFARYHKIRLTVPMVKVFTDDKLRRRVEEAMSSESVSIKSLAEMGNKLRSEVIIPL